MKKIKAIISGGGTGGHIFPALSIANELKERHPDADILFVGAQGRMEMEKVPAAGYKIIGLPVVGFPRKPGLKMVKFVWALWDSMRQAKKIVKEFQPDIAVGVGGYASGPTLKAAIRKGVPALIQEQNSYAGMTNKLLSKKVDKICVAYDHMERYFPQGKIILTGNPVRKGLMPEEPMVDEAKKHFKLPEGAKTLLIVGGSLGARSINNAVIKNLETIRGSQVQVVWQTGAYYFEEMSQLLANNKPGNLQIHQFLSRMDLAYAASDLVVTRAGASTISELCLLGKASVLVPSPNVAEDHQTKNAQALVDKNAAVMVKDTEIDEKLFATAFGLLEDKTIIASLAENCRKLGKPNATKEIVDELEKLMA